MVAERIAAPMRTRTETGKLGAAEIPPSLSMEYKSVTARTDATSAPRAVRQRERTRRRQRPGHQSSPRHELLLQRHRTAWFGDPAASSGRGFNQDAAAHVYMNRRTA